jgi:eukaryotic-like serine/threonine-protein kinase
MADDPGFESRVLAFERAWSGNHPPEIETFLPPDRGGPAWRRLLIELICVDLEFQWRRGARGRESPAPVLEDYLRRFPMLGPLREVPLDLIVEEYRVRCRWGSRVEHGSFTARFEGRRALIEPLLRDVDAELREEADEIPPPRVPAERGARAAVPDPGESLSYGDYVLQRLIGAGRTGRVYRSRQRSLARDVAVKYLRKSIHGDDRAVSRFLVEARTVARLRHPGIVGVHGLGRSPGGGYFIVMDFVDGPDLAHVVRRGTVCVDDAVRWTIEACDAIARVHERGVVHCDLKPGNLLLDPGGGIRVTDFGLARSLGEDGDDRVEGTAPFMAPEQVSGWWGAVGPHTDVYGLGAVLYALLTGRAPFMGRTTADVLAQVVSAIRVVAPGEHRPDLPAAVGDVCLRSLAKHPGERYASVGELRRALELAERPPRRTDG